MSNYLFGVKERSNEYVVNAMIRYLETMSELWPIKLRMLKSDQAGDWGSVDIIRKEMDPVVSKAIRPLNEALYWRLKAKELYESNEGFRKTENEKLSKDFVRFINHWCYTSDPRIVSFGLPSMLPFVLWPKQEEFLKWVDDAYKVGRSWLAEKSRGWGITWLLSAYYVWHWVYHDGFIGGFGSRDKDAVDKIGDPDTIFAKVRFIIYNLPTEMLPKSYQNRSIADQSPNDSYLRIVNPERESTIRGEGGDNIGAGGRSSIYVVDESALVAHPKMVDDSLSYTTNCRGDVSTVRGMNEFGEKRHSGRVRVFTSWFYQDPSKYNRWRENKMPTRDECAFLDHEYLDKGELVVAQELLIDYSRSVEDSFIPADWVKAAVDFDLPPQGFKQTGFDVSGGGENKSVHTTRIGPVVFEPHEFSYGTMQENLEHSLSIAENDKVELYAYDADGIGGDIWGHIKFTERKMKFNLYGINGNSSPSEKFIFEDNMMAKDKFRNKRSENYWNLRERFRKTYEHRTGAKIYDYQELISIPNNTKLITQLSQPKRKPGIKIQVESKTDMKSRGVKSPDYADSCVNAFADPDKSSMVISEFNYREGSSAIEDFQINFEDPVAQQFVSLVTTKDMKTYALGCWWIPAYDNPCLKVYCDFLVNSSEVKELVGNIKTVMCVGTKPIREWVCNEEMLSSLEDGKDNMWYIYKKEGVLLRKNYTNDYATSIVVVNRLFANGIIKMHKRCERPMMQVSNWRLENGKPQPNLGFAMALCQVVTRLKTKKEIRVEHIEPNWTPRNPYKGAVGHFGNTAKQEVPGYMKVAEKQVKGAVR